MNYIDLNIQGPLVLLLVSAPIHVHNVCTLTFEQISAMFPNTQQVCFEVIQEPQLNMNDLKLVTIILILYVC